MKFKLFLEAHEDMHSWLRPDGTFKSLEGRDHGDIFANDIAFDRALKDGWFRISYLKRYEHELFANNPFRQLSQNQKKVLIDLAIENRMDKIIYDNEINLRVIWSRDERF